MRKKREFITAKISTNEQGYEALDYRQLSDVTPAEYEDIMGVYARKMKAKSSVLSAIRTFELCPRLCGLEKTKGSCFSFQLRKCKGACIGKEPAELYNRRLRLAFERTAIEEWPFDGAITVSEDIAHLEGIIVDQWRIIGRFMRIKDNVVSQPYEEDFDLDAYKILKAFLKNPEEKLSIKPFLGV